MISPVMEQELHQQLTIYFKSHGFWTAFCESACQRRNQSIAAANFTIPR